MRLRNIRGSKETIAASDYVVQEPETAADYNSGQIFFDKEKWSNFALEYLLFKQDYIFDIERFTSFEGNTGPYILYTTVRIKSILNRYKEEGGNLDTLKILAAGSDSEKALMLEASKFNQVITNAYEEKAPHKICSYIYELANAFNRFYHETKILAEEDQAKKESYLALLMLVKNILEACIDMLGFEAPERM